MRPVWMRRTATGTLLGAALAGCDKPAATENRPATQSAASALATDGPNQVVLSVPGMT